MSGRAAKCCCAPARSIRPAILQRSGIGPREWLDPLGIKLVADRPVGKHLLDHPILGLMLDLREGARANTNMHRHTNCCVRYASGLAGAGLNDMIMIAGNLRPEEDGGTSARASPSPLSRR